MYRKRIIYNLASGLMTQGVAFLLAFLVPRLMLLSYGSEVRGFTSTVTQIFAYLWLLEAGVGLATTQALYSPLGKGKHARINEIMAATAHYYQRTGILYFFFVLLLAAWFSLFTHTGLSAPQAAAVVLLQGLPNVLSYLIQGKYRLLLDADGRSYVINNLQAGTQLFVNLGKAGLLMAGAGIVGVQALGCAGALLQIGILLPYAKKRYPWLDFKVKPDFAAISQKSAVLVHQISGVIFNNTDVILVSFFCGFKLVSVYAVYKAFFTYADNVITTLSSSFLFSLGQMFHIDKKKFSAWLDVYESVYLIVVFSLFTTVGLLMVPLVQIYTRGVCDINYTDYQLPLLFSVISLTANSKLPLNQAITFAEHFRETRRYAVTEALLNLSLSLLGVWCFGMYGVLGGTVAALLYRLHATVWYASKNILGRSVAITYRKIFAAVAVSFLLALFCRQVTFSFTSYMGILAAGAVLGTLNLFLFSAAVVAADPPVVVVLLGWLRERRSHFPQDRS